MTNSNDSRTRFYETQVPGNMARPRIAILYLCSAAMMFFPLSGSAEADIPAGVGFEAYQFPLHLNLGWSVDPNNTYKTGTPTWVNSYTIDIPNVAIPTNVKTVWLELDFGVGAKLPPPPTVSLYVPDQYSATITNNQGVVSTGPNDGEGTTSIEASPAINTITGSMTYMWTINPQPGDEQIILPSSWTFGTNSGGATEEEVAYNCVPEPSTLVLATIGAVGGLAYGWSRRRKQKRQRPGPPDAIE